MEQSIKQTKPAWRENLVPLAVAIALTIAVLVYRGELIGWFLGKPMTQSESTGIQLKVGSITAELSLQPDPPRQQKNTLAIVLRSRDNTPIANATIKAILTMPPMGQMAEMRAVADIQESGQGHYLASYNLPMGGTWTLALTVESSMGSIEARYSLTVGTQGLVLVESGGEAGPASVSVHFNDVARAEVVRALAAYETIRTELAADRADKVEPPSQALVEAMMAAKQAQTDLPATVVNALDKAKAAAESMIAAVTIEDARAAFASLSEPIISLATVDSRVAENLHVFECPMTNGYNRWLQPSKKMMNPYMGAEMLTCGSEIALTSVTSTSTSDHDHTHGSSDEIDHYTCPMDTWVKEHDEGTCPVCGMDLVPVTVEEIKTGVLRVDHRRRQLIGLKTARIERRNLIAKISAVGRVVYDETRIADVTVRTSGFVKGLRVEALGERVRRGQRLFSLYSPQLYSAQKELILASAQVSSASSEGGRARASALVRGARQRLLLWNISNRQIEQIIATGKASEYIPITSPASGYVVAKAVVEGASVNAGDRLFRIADLDKVWVEADIYEQDLAQIAVGQEATVSLTHRADHHYRGKVAFIYPYLDNKSRTTRVRIELPNKGLELKPDMYADVELESVVGERLAVPEQAVIYSGPRRIVFVDAGSDKLAPRLVVVGVKTEGYFEVISGLEQGDLVVTSGNFLISAESRLKAATGLW